MNTSYLMRTAAAIGAVAALVCMAAEKTSAQTTLPATQDTRLLSVLPTTNNGQSDFLAVYNLNNNVQHSLLQYDVTGLTNISSAILTLHLHSPYSFNGTPEDVFRATRNWIETEATWNNATTPQPWSTAGGDYAGPNNDTLTPYATAAPIETDTSVSFDVTGLVQAWANNTITNNGFLLLDNSPNNTHFYSSRTPTPGLQPTLTITSSDTPSTPEPGSVALLASFGIGCTSLLARRRRR
jgi:hypothetical protein